MTYFLDSRSIDHESRIEISKDDYLKYKEAKKALNSAFDIETRFEMIILNFTFLEKQLFELSFAYMVDGPGDYDILYQNQLNLNLALSNLLTTTAQYKDQLKRDIKHCICQKTDGVSIIKQLDSVTYDSCKSYRLMSALRDFVQHRALPVRRLTMGTTREETVHGNRLKYTIDFILEKTYIKDDEKFNKKVLQEQSDPIDLKKHTRVFVESISHIHDFVRKLISDKLSDARSIIQQAFDSFDHSKKIDYAYVTEEKNGETVEKIPLFLEWDNVRIKLANKKRSLTNISRKYLSS